jgi:putative flippase GtrA
MNTLRKRLRYCAVSAIATLTSLTVLGVLVATRTASPAWANVVATAVGTVPSFELNRRWVWRKTGGRSVAAEIVPFCVLSFAGLLLSTVAVDVAARWASAIGFTGVMRTLAVEVANIAAFGSLWVLQYVVLDRVLFAPRADDYGRNCTSIARGSR